MNTRQQTRENREEMRNSLLQNFRDGVLRPGDALPTVRDLANRHNLSPATAQRVLRGLADEGVLQLRQGAGAFVGRLPHNSQRAFAVIFGEDFFAAHQSHLHPVRNGFEAEIAQRGATALTLTPKTSGLSQVMGAVGTGELPIGGSFVFGSTNPDFNRSIAQIAADLGGPHIFYVDNPTSELHNHRRQSDTVHFDDFDGAAQAVRHLWERGHRDIALLAMHCARTPATDFGWSRRREAGFRAAMAQLGAPAHVFHPQSGPLFSTSPEQRAFGMEAAGQLLPQLRQGKIDAIVCVNQYALAGLSETVRQSGLPERKWPTLIAFDDEAQDDHLQSVIRLPWEELGRAAARALWQRSVGTPDQQNAPAREIAVPMRLVVRLSCLNRSFRYAGTSRLAHTA